MEMRRVEKLHGGIFVPTEFDQLKQGDHFKLFDPAGEKRVEDGIAVYEATGDAFPLTEPESGLNWGIKVKQPEGYTYFLKHKTTGEEISLGQSAELKSEVAEQHHIDPENWSDSWEFLCRRV